MTLYDKYKPEFARIRDYLRQRTGPWADRIVLGFIFVSAETIAAWTAQAKVDFFEVTDAEDLAEIKATWRFGTENWDPSPERTRCVLVCLG